MRLRCTPVDRVSRKQPVRACQSSGLLLACQLFAGFGLVAALAQSALGGLPAMMGVLYLSIRVVVSELAPPGVITASGNPWSGAWTPRLPLAADLLLLAPALAGYLVWLRG